MTVRVVVRRDLKQFFPKEFSNRELLGKFLDYVMNNFFQSSNEEYVNGFIGKKSVALDEGDYYIQEPSTERQEYQLIPTAVSDDLIVGYNNFINTLKQQGCDTNDQNRLLSDNYWSWCPPINVDMFLNYNYYYWIEEGPTPIELDVKTNAIMDIIGKKEYTYIKKQLDKNNEEVITEQVQFMSGMRIIFKNDENSEYNNNIYIVEGVGKSIQLIEDNDTSDNDSAPDYYVMERGSQDGNSWSLHNRWFHRSVVASSNKTNRRYQQAKKPIICFNKNIELYNYGVYNRGYVDIMTTLQKKDINGLTPQPIQGVELKDGMTILITGETDTENNNRIYQISGISSLNIVILQPVINGLSDNGSAVNGEGIKVKSGTYADQYFYFENNKWIKGQQKVSTNQAPLFQLYDMYGEKFNTYKNSTFKGSKIFDYKVVDNNDDLVIDEDLNKTILTNGYGNYIFENILDTETFNYSGYENTTETYSGLKFFKYIDTDNLSNDWHLSNNKISQYITTDITIVADNESEFTLAYQPDKMNNQKSSFVYLNGNLLVENKDYEIENKKLKLKNQTVKVNDSLYIKLLVLKLNETIANGYYYDIPYSLTANAFNENITEINYSECLDQFKSIIENQTNFEGNSVGDNNYIDTLKDLSLGTEILQHASPILKTMVLNANQKTNIRNVMSYVSNEYSKFKIKFKNVLDSMSFNNEFASKSLETIIVDAMAKINIGKEGLKPFYNNGVGTLDFYIPSTPAYLGMDNCYKPEIITMDVNGKEKQVLLCHDGSYTTLYEDNDERNDILLELEKEIYDSINYKFKQSQNIYNKYDYIPGYFRQTDYSYDEYKLLMSSFLEQWCNTNKINYTTHDNFDMADAFTWNYSACYNVDGNKLSGSYKAIYLYYYDTYKPHETPWEMLGFGSKPTWWEDLYGSKPYTSQNIQMWKDIENGYIAQGVNKGYHKEFARPQLIEKYLPVDDKGQLLNPLQIGIAVSEPIEYFASKPWNAMDMGEIETIWTYTSEYRFALQTVLYLMKPLKWLESNWDNEHKEILFKGTEYEQLIYSDTLNRPTPKEIYIHNEEIDNKLIRKIGVQQWISDYLVHENMGITKYAGDIIRNAHTQLSYRCGRFYKQDSLKIVSDNYGVIPSQNYQLKIYQSLTDKQASYSAIVITKVGEGYMIDGYDVNEPYFKILQPILTGKKTGVEINNRSVFYYNNWDKNKITKIKYKTIFTSVQELFNVICGYGKYLEEIEKWVFNRVLENNNTVIDFNSKAEDFLRWTSVNPENNQLIMLNPGYEGMVLAHTGFLDIVGQYVNGQWTVMNTMGLPIHNDMLTVYRHNGYTSIETKNEVITLLKVNVIEQEHLILFDNKTIYNDVLYDPLLCIKAQRLKVMGIGVSDWDGTLYTPGYLIDYNGAVPNYDKLVEDFKYFFDTDDVRSQGLFGEYAKKTIGFQKIPSMERLLLDDRNIFDFYKGMLRDKGTRRSFNKMNRSNYIMSNKDSSINLYENWAFKVADFGYTADNYLLEFKVDTSKITQDPQIFSFTTNEVAENKPSSINYGYNDKAWLKKIFVKENNSFSYTDSNVMLPTGGFVNKDEVNYIVADITELEEIKENIQLNETVWVVKSDGMDWNVYKKIPNGLMSLRIDNIAQLETFDTSNLSNGDLVYVTKDIINNNLDKINDVNNVINQEEVILDRKAWSVFMWQDMKFILYRVQNKLIDMKKINKCFMINDDTNETLSKIHLYDPLQCIIPNNILNEVNYITSVDPVTDYNDFYKWGDEKVGLLWWDTSKVRYLDYHQGDIYYRRNNWGKQLPGSEIAIMEWYKSVEKPEDGIKYVEKTIYNSQTSTNETYYYYWIKNPSEIPETHFRENSALTISLVINSPQDQGVVWMSPIQTTFDDDTFIMGNFDNVAAGINFVIQMNFKNEIEDDTHAEWVLVREGNDDKIPEQLWTKMTDSLVGKDELNQTVPDTSLNDANKLGILIRPRQTMFNSMEESRHNFVDVVNEIFASRDVATFTDTATEQFKQIFEDFDPYPESDYNPDEDKGLKGLATFKDMTIIQDTQLIGKKLLVRNDENHGDIWTLWYMNNIGQFTMVDYQKYDVRRYWKYTDLYINEDAQYEQPLRTFNVDEEREQYNAFVKETQENGYVIKIIEHGKWKLLKYDSEKKAYQTIGGQDDAIQLLPNLYNFISENDQTDFIEKTKEVSALTKFEYLKNETEIVLKKIISYFE